jgi:hypothetical protein
MRTAWRNAENQLQSFADWRGRLGPKNSRQGTSAPTLAAVWTGPVELFGALRNQGSLSEAIITDVVVEAQSPVDEFSGDRNHDLVIRGYLPDGARVVLCVEAKAGEDLGLTVAQQASAADRAKVKADSLAASSGKPMTSNAPARLRGLLQRFVPYDTVEPRVQQLRYQLLTALAGTLSEAETCDARHAVLMIHEFLTDDRNDERVIHEHDHDIWNFCTTVFDLEPPGSTEVPWCIELPQLRWSSGIKLYLARAITDLRKTTLEQPGHPQLR